VESVSKMGKGTDGKPLLFDFMCCGGGAAKGYADAGFEVIGFDIEDQPKFPYTFYKWDVLKLDPDWIAEKADGIHASPPCKTHTTMKRFSSKHHIDLVPQTRELLIATGLPYIIENVPGAPLRDPITLCGSSFGLYVRRHRLFESNFKLESLECRHAWQTATSPGFWPLAYHSGEPIATWSPVIGIFGGGQGLGEGETELWRKHMKIDWLSKKQMSQAIPPPYTEFLGRQLMEQML
jgi:DNA (cytosine-5)-methyltransferase 1